MRWHLLDIYAASFGRAADQCRLGFLRVLLSDDLGSKVEV